MYALVRYPRKRDQSKMGLQGGRREEEAMGLVGSIVMSAGTSSALLIGYEMLGRAFVLLGVIGTQCSSI